MPQFFKQSTFVLSILILASLLFATALSSNKKRFTTNQKKTLRKGMVLFDVELRNIASAISLRYINSIQSSSEIFASPLKEPSLKYKKERFGMYQILRSKNEVKYLKNIWDMSKKIRKKMAGMTKPEEVNWSFVQTRYRQIIENCRSCHQKMSVGGP